MRAALRRLVLAAAVLLAAGPTFAQAPPVGWPTGSTTAPVVLVPASAVNGAGQASVPIRVPDGLVGAPGLTFTSQQNLGLYYSGSNQFCTSSTATATLCFNTNANTSMNGIGLGFSAGTGAADSVFWRLGSASLSLGNGTPSDFSGTLKLNTINATNKIQLNGVDFATGTPCSNTAASTDITGTLTKTYFSISCKIPANTLATIGDFVKVSMRGLYSGNATDTMAMTLEACQVSGCASGTKVTVHTATAITLTAVSNQAWWLDTQIVSFTTGAGGTHDAQGHIFYELTGTTATPDALPNTAVVTWDDTVDEYLTMSVTFSTTSGNDHASIRSIVGTIQ